jgi:exonuclease VII small subunit
LDALVSECIRFEKDYDDLEDIAPTLEAIAADMERQVKRLQKCANQYKQNKHKKIKP